MASTHLFIVHCGRRFGALAQDALRRTPRYQSSGAGRAKMSRLVYFAGGAEPKLGKTCAMSISNVSGSNNGFVPTAPLMSAGQSARALFLARDQLLSRVRTPSVLFAASRLAHAIARARSQSAARTLFGAVGRQLFQRINTAQKPHTLLPLALRLGFSPIRTDDKGRAQKSYCIRVFR